MRRVYRVYEMGVQTHSSYSVRSECTDTPPLKGGVCLYTLAIPLPLMQKKNTICTPPTKNHVDPGMVAYHPKKSWRLTSLENRLTLTADDTNSSEPKIPATTVRAHRWPGTPAHETFRTTPINPPIPDLRRRSANPESIAGPAGVQQDGLRMSEKSYNVASWWAGSFPVWIVLLLLGIISFAGQSVLSDNGSVHAALMSTAQSNLARITRLEEQMVALRETNARIERKLDAIENLMRASP